MNAATDFWWSPFRGDPWREQCWKRYIVRDPAAVRRSLVALRAALPPARLARLNGVAHPLALDYVMSHSRWRLLEVGAMLAALPSVGEFRGRLLNPEKYVPACAELQGGILLQRMGFDVERDPANAQREPGTDDVEGPDWGARQRAGRTGVEVKCPEQSERAIAQQTAAVETLFALGRLLPHGQGVDGSLNPTTLRTLTNRTWVNKERIQDCALDAAIGLDESGAVDTELGRFRYATSGQSSLGGLELDASHEEGRLRDSLQTAATQLQALLPDPGIVLLSTARDHGLAGRTDAISGMLAEDWARDIALVLVVVPTFPGFALLPVKGARFSDLRGFRFRNVRTCDRGHLHVPTFGGPRSCDGI